MCIVGVQLAGGCMSAEHAGTRRWGTMLAHAKVPPVPPLPLPILFYRLAYNASSSF